jgi:hypothetical protein
VQAFRRIDSEHLAYDARGARIERSATREALRSPIAASSFFAFVKRIRRMGADPTLSP